MEEELSPTILVSSHQTLLVVWAGAYQHGWICVSGVSVRHVRAMGAHGEGPSACIGGLGVAGCGRSAAWGHMEASWWDAMGRVCGT